MICSSVNLVRFIVRIATGLADVVTGEAFDAEPGEGSVGALRHGGGCNREGGSGGEKGSNGLHWYSPLTARPSASAFHPVRRVGHGEETAAWAA